MNLSSQVSPRSVSLWLPLREGQDMTETLTVEAKACVQGHRLATEQLVRLYSCPWKEALHTKACQTYVSCIETVPCAVAWYQAICFVQRRNR